jgi:hypothetical protein
MDERMSSARKYREGYFDLIKRMQIAALSLPDKDFTWLVKKLLHENKHRLSISLEDDNRITYRAHDRKYSKSYKKSLQKFMRDQLGSVSDGPCIDLFVRKVFALEDKENFTVEFLEGDEIETAYRRKIGASSCMTGECAHFTTLYSENPKAVRLALYCDREGLEARALLWSTDEGITVLDRVYPDYTSIVERMHQWAIRKGYVYRVDNGYPCTGRDIELSDDRTYTVTLKQASNETLPYLDTFTYCTSYGDEVVLTNNCTPRNRIVFECIKIDGSTPNSEGYNTCYDCGRRVDEDYCYHYGDDSYCEGCYNDNFSDCCRCETTISHDDSRYSELTGDVYCDSCYSDLFTTCGDCDAEMLNEDSIEVQVNWGSYGVCDSCITNYYECEDCGDYTEKQVLVYGANRYKRNVCLKCSTHYYRECKECGDLVMEFIKIADHQYLCSDCNVLEEAS